MNMLGKAITLRASGAPEETIIDGENARRGIKCDNGETAATKIIGFSITGGFGFNGNGGGIYCTDSSPTISGCTISGNTAANDGGGIWCNGGTPTISGCTILSNGATYGAGISCYLSSPTLTKCLISDNSAEYKGGGIFCNDNSSPTITDCTISGNTAFYYDGGGIYCVNQSNPTLIGCTISGNIAISGSGGAISCDQGSPTLTNCLISENQAANKGGGIWCFYESNPTITNCTITNNVAVNFGGGVYIETSLPTFIDTQVCGNLSDQIYGIWNDNGGNEINEECPDVVGACCTGNQSGCVASAQADCEYFGGTFMGYGAQCADVSCPTSCLGDINGDGQVSTNDLLTVIANWGVCP